MSLFRLDRLTVAVIGAGSGIGGRPRSPTASRNDGLDGPVCTAGINVRKPIAVLDDAEVERVLDVNLKGTFWAMRAAARAMRERRKASIVVLSSIRSQVVEPGQGIYAATKAGLVQGAGARQGGRAGGRWNPRRGQRGRHRAGCARRARGRVPRLMTRGLLNPPAAARRRAAVDR